MAKDRLSDTLAVILHADVEGSTELVHQDKQIAHKRIQGTFHRFGDTIFRCSPALFLVRPAPRRRPQISLQTLLEGALTRPSLVCILTVKRWGPRSHSGTSRDVPDSAM